LDNLTKHICTAVLDGCSADPLSEMKTKSSFNFLVAGFPKKKSQEMAVPLKRIFHSYTERQFQAHS